MNFVIFTFSSFSIHGGAVSPLGYIISYTSSRNTQNYFSILGIKAKMRFSTIFLACSASAAETDDSPISKLNYLETITTQIFSSDSIILSDRLANRWTGRFITNIKRMRDSFARCGTIPSESESYIDEQYDIDNACRATKQLTTGFSNWVSRHMSSCNGQKNHSYHEKRMGKWQNLLFKGNRFDSSFAEFISHKILLKCLKNSFSSIRTD